MMKRILSLVGLGLAVALGGLAGCQPPASRPAAPAAAPAPAQSMVHPVNGLKLDLPAGYRASSRPDGFLVEPDPPVAARLPLQITVTFATVAQAPLVAARQREVAGRRFDFTVTAADNPGSGGSILTLTACRQEGGGTLCLWQSKFGEHGEPEFELWAIAGGASRAL